MMAIGKWSMYLSAVLFFLIGFGALAVAVVPGADEWFAEQILESGGFEADEGLIGLVADSEGVRTTSWILAASFIPSGFLFVWAGRWFRSMEGGGGAFGSMGSSMAMMRDATAMFQTGAGTGVVSTAEMAGRGPGTPAPAAATPAPAPAAPPPSGPVVEPPDPTAGGIIS
jgi:hypothetical protein